MKQRIPLLALSSLLLTTAVLLGCSSTWYPTDEDPIYTDEDGVTWGVLYRPEGAPEYALVDPDMLLTQGDDGVVGYVNVKEKEAAAWQVNEDYAGIPGSHDVYVTINLYEFLTYEVIGTDTFLTRATVEVDDPGQNANTWLPEQPGDVSITDDGRKWGGVLSGGSCDMLYVMASDTGLYGFVSASELEKAEEETMLAVSRSGKNATIMLDVVLYDTDTVIGQYAVTTYA